MKETNKTLHWAALTVLLGAVALIAACDQGTRSVLPTQPAARNFEQPQTTVVAAAFTCEEKGGTDALTVIFANESTGEIDKYRWDFGDRGTSTLESPVHRYRASGDYVVTLTVSNSISSDTVAKVCQAGAGAAPPPVPLPTTVTAAFTCEAGGTDLLTVIFTNNSLGAIDRYSWTFGDGATSSSQNPVHTYGSSGEYLVELKVSNSTSSDDLAIFCQAGES